MHDPLVVAFDIPGPWIRRSTLRLADSDPRRGVVRLRYTNPENLGEPVYPWWRPAGWRVFAAGSGWRFGNLAVVWHREPGGHDSGEVCKHYSRWQNPDGTWDHKMTRGWMWHVHHWKIQIPPLQHLRRQALTRCEWCGGRSRKGDYANFSHSWDGEKSQWWRGERGLFHEDCSSVSTAHRTCACSLIEGSWEHGAGGSPYGKCATCGLFRAWQDADDIDSPRTATTALLKMIPKGQRNALVMAEVHRLWEAKP